MEMDDEFLEITDLDWFSCYQNGLLAHFATGGRGFVPASIRSSIYKYELVVEYFQSLEEEFDFEIIESNLPEFKDARQRERYLNSFLNMAKKGLFSYDVCDGGYKLIAAPKGGRHSDELPQEVLRNIYMLGLPSDGDIKRLILS